MPTEIYRIDKNGQQEKIAALFENESIEMEPNPNRRNLPGELFAKNYPDFSFVEVIEEEDGQTLISLGENGPKNLQIQISGTTILTETTPMMFLLESNESITITLPDKDIGICIRRLNQEPANTKIILLNSLLSFYITEQENKFPNSDSSSPVEKIILPSYLQELIDQTLMFVENVQQLYGLQTDQYLQSKNLAIKKFNNLLLQIPEILEEIQIN